MHCEGRVSQVVCPGSEQRLFLRLADFGEITFFPQAWQIVSLNLQTFARLSGEPHL